MNLSDLRKRFQLPGVIFDDQAGGLTRVRINSPVASGELFLHGAHCTAWQPAGHAAVLWMSEHSYYLTGKPIRGGVPICFPWFGPHPRDTTLPAHGWARLKQWELHAVHVEPETGATRVTCVTRIEPFDLEYTVSFGATLTLSLTTRLSAVHPQAESFEDALHTYLRVSDIRQAKITGLEAMAYIDKMDGAKLKPATQSAIKFSAETDRVYLDSGEACTLHDVAASRRIIVSKSGSQSTIVWNPWTDKSARMPDFGDHEWPSMVCIETANVGADAIQLQPGSEHTTLAVLQVASTM